VSLAGKGLSPVSLPPPPHSRAAAVSLALPCNQSRLADPLPQRTTSQAASPSSLAAPLEAMCGVRFSRSESLRVSLGPSESLRATESSTGCLLSGVQRPTRPVPVGSSPRLCRRRWPKSAQPARGSRSTCSSSAAASSCGARRRRRWRRRRRRRDQFLDSRRGAGLMGCFQALR
jgi:hypothetical protein